ncbi:hypothetical protein HCN44_004184 [Aphidius gifuensis]|uniref:peptidyl-tRNA hydrolase n=1 Tax=Aphidius gifuensis TaxID=684658 RepID=A0A835CSV6_APHGI|nr:peptidyl-tRNA hydrolase 2, mitochondrial-like [Aphidius gifuensis]KAF7994712.1 hypothetical protein HCN44_004184 [Aphidius gifuensis]
MDFWNEFLKSIDDLKLGFFVALALGYGLYRLSKITIKPETTTNDNDMMIDDTNGEYKMVLVIRNDLKMGKGKVAAQCAHAAVAGYAAAMKIPKYLQAWEESGHKKITLKVDSVEELDKIKKEAKKKGLIAVTIQDAGRTQIAAGSKTVCCVGPGPDELVDEVTGHLKLY